MNHHYAARDNVKVAIHECILWSLCKFDSVCHLAVALSFHQTDTEKTTGMTSIITFFCGFSQNSKINNNKISWWGKRTSFYGNTNLSRFKTKRYKKRDKKWYNDVLRLVFVFFFCIKISIPTNKRPLYSVDIFEFLVNWIVFLFTILINSS